MKNKNSPGKQSSGESVVRPKGLEPPRLSAPDPKSGAATNYATAANGTAKIRLFMIWLIQLFNFFTSESITSGKWAYSSACTLRATSSGVSPGNSSHCAWKMISPSS